MSPNHPIELSVRAEPLHAAIKARWSKFTDFELGALAHNGDLVNQVCHKVRPSNSRGRGPKVEGPAQG